MNFSKSLNPRTLLLLVCFAFGVFAQAPAVKPVASLRQPTFDIVWRTVRDKHCDPTLGGVSWDFACGLQDLGRAVVVGERSAGAALPSLLEKPPTGAVFQDAIDDFKTATGTLVEGRGALPEVAAPLTRAGLLAGRDTQLAAAVAQLDRMQKRAAVGGK